MDKDFAYHIVLHCILSPSSLLEWLTDKCASTGMCTGRDGKEKKMKRGKVDAPTAYFFADVRPRNKNIDFTCQILQLNHGIVAEIVSFVSGTFI